MPSSNLFVAPQAAPNWAFTPQSLLDETHKLIRDSKQFYDSLAQLSNPTVENLVKPYMHHENRIGLIESQLTFPQQVSADKELRDASAQATEFLQNFGIEQSLRHDLFLQFDKLWSELKDKSFEKGTREYEIYKYVEKIHQDYTRDGLQLPEDKREKVKQLKIKIAANSLEFSKNLGEQKEFVAFTKEELDGVSDSVMDQFEQFQDENGTTKYKVTFKYPDIFPVLKTAKNPKTRKLAFTRDQNKVPQNEKLFMDTLQLRNELADTLGYSTYANYNLELKMAKNQNNVWKFLNELKGKLRPLGVKEAENLKQIKKKECQSLDLPYDGHYYVWDHRYYDNKYLKDNYNVDLEKISEYYPLESTIKGMLSIYETLLKLKFVEERDSKTKSVWHEDVKQLAVWKMDNPSKPEFVGWIYFDLHPRDGKYGHAANFGISASYVKEDGTRSYPVTALVCNFSKPSSKKPSLLKHNEISTFFHELGHGIHDLVGENRLTRFNGPGAVPWDFVEAPSQMLEFWTWNERELYELSSHYESGEKIPKDLLRSLISTKHVDGALFALRQLHFGLFDMHVHTSKNVADLDLLKLWNELREEVSLVENGDTFTKGYNSFGHIMSDSYSAGYYGYMWAEVFAADMYHTRFAADPLDSKAGVQYRDVVLGRGGLYDTNDNLREFLGREPSEDAFLKELGLN
ncbi:hypothetical protein ZYGR_0M00150 [Zygosaccharomyces rouxii]|uniref:Peptidase M3A/M3B catalytic domain-containing protein n=1 Tax=Zygosaccharomyces rouxii TaxID=4956 RepID=A0A1Q2ZYR7_ZYGRO|nr:hypothetical protein ZYGR_0M00150 [Zygosaccharomyces rouxii]